MWRARRWMWVAAGLAACLLAVGCGASGNPEDGLCQADSCGGHGSCDDSTGAVVCTCATGYSGAACGDCAAGFVEWPAGSGDCVADPCSPDPCTTAGAVPGSCTQTGAAAHSCACQQGFAWVEGACQPQTECLDPDGDGYGAGLECLGPDCAPGDPAVHPGAAEPCNGVDDDCDAETDEDFPDLDQPCDGDGDQCVRGSFLCAADGLGVECVGDHDDGCDDGSLPICEMVVPACECAFEILAYQGACYRCVNPATCAPCGLPGCTSDADCPPGEWCDPCGTSSCPICEDCQPACRPLPACLDPDGDGYGEGLECLGPDCAPADPAIHPGALELCNGVDEDCDTETDEDFPDVGLPCDGDGDQCVRGSFLCAADGLGVECVGDHDDGCDDGSLPICDLMIPACDCEFESLAYQDACYRCVNPASCAPWGVPGCASDADCPPGEWCDPCGTSSCPICEDCLPACRPLPACLDPDGDGYGEGLECLGPDCAPGDPAVHPEAPDHCNGVDENCDGLVDEAFPDVGLPCGLDVDGDQCVRGRFGCAADGLGLVCSDDHLARCDDGSLPICDMPTPACDCEFEILAYQDACYRCVNPASCAPWGAPGCASDADCPPGEWCDPCGTSSCPICDDCLPACG